MTNNTQKKLLWWIAAIVFIAVLGILEFKKPKPAYARFYTHRGNTFKDKNNKDKNNIEKAITSYQRAIIHDPNHALAHYELAVLFEGSGNKEESLKYYQNVVKLGPHWLDIIEQLKTSDFKTDFPYAESCFKIGDNYFSQKRWPEAIEYFKRALEFNRRHAQAAYQLGLAYMLIGEKDKAHKEAQRIGDFEDRSLGTKLKAQLDQKWSRPVEY